MSDLATGIISSVVTLIGSYFVFKQNDKSNQLKYITEERQKWREKIRKLSVAFMTGQYVDYEHKILSENELRNIREKVAVRLNPTDYEDNNILCLMDLYIERQCSISREKIRVKLRVAFASLLKHDWERAKNETKMKSNSSKIILFLISLFIVTSFFICANWLPEKINFFTYEACLKNNTSFSDLFILKAIGYTLLILAVYKLLKYWGWYFKNDFEKNQNISTNSNDDCSNLHKYLGYSKRDEVSEFDETQFQNNRCKKNENE